MRKKGKVLVKNKLRMFRNFFIGKHTIHLEIFCFEHSGRFFLPFSPPNCFALLRLCDMWLGWTNLNKLFSTVTLSDYLTCAHHSFTNKNINGETGIYNSGGPHHQLIFRLQSHNIEITLTADAYLNLKMAILFFS